ARGAGGQRAPAWLVGGAGLGPSDVQLLSLGGTARVTRLASGELAAAVLDERWITRALDAGAGEILLDFRRPEDAARLLGGPFYEVLSVVRADPKALPDLEPVLAAYARALVRVQAWLAATPAAAAAERPP